MFGGPELKVKSTSRKHTQLVVWNTAFTSSNPRCSLHTDMELIRTDHDNKTIRSLSLPVCL